MCTVGLQLHIRASRWEHQSLKQRTEESGSTCRFPVTLISHLTPRSLSLLVQSGHGGLVIGQ